MTTERELRPHESGLNTLLIRRTYDSTPEDVWDAITDPERVVRWCLEGNASGDTWGLGAGWELGLTSLESFLAGKRFDGRAIDAMANAPPAEMGGIGRLAGEVSDAWAAVIAQR